jgi:hypothetical protein
MECDICGEKNKGHYRLIEVKKKLIWVCAECRTGRRLYRRGHHPNTIFRELQTPLWRKLGLKPKKNELEKEKYLKWRGMDYADYRREQDYYQAKYPSALPEFESHFKKYGRKNAPDPTFQRTDKRPF